MLVGVIVCGYRNAGLAICSVTVTVNCNPKPRTTKKEEEKKKKTPSDWFSYFQSHLSWIRVAWCGDKSWMHFGMLWRVFFWSVQNSQSWPMCSVKSTSPLVESSSKEDQSQNAVQTRNQSWRTSFTIHSQSEQSSPSSGRTVKKVKLQTRRRRWSPALYTPPFYWSLQGAKEWNTPLIHLKDPSKHDKHNLTKSVIFLRQRKVLDKKAKATLPPFLASLRQLLISLLLKLHFIVYFNHIRLVLFSSSWAALSS